MKRATALLAVLSAVFVAGCQTTEELAQQDDMICQGYGLPKGSPEYVQCRQFQQADRTARYQADQQAYAIWSAANSLSRIGLKNN
jgi:hypothetical protein